jgi:hypothetical protein
MNKTASGFPRTETEPISDASYVRHAGARFHQVKDITDAERTATWKRIQAEARQFGVEVNEDNWPNLKHGGR